MKTKQRPTGIRRQRLLAGLTMQNVADALKAAGVKPANIRAVWDWEHGVPIPEHVRNALRKVLR